MQMKAKYPGKCRRCGGAIVAGDDIEWSKGTGASHTVCPTKSVSQPSRSCGTQPVETKPNEEVHLGPKARRAMEKEAMVSMKVQKPMNAIVERPVEQPRPFVPPTLPDPLDTIVVSYYYDGEYCSGWMVDGAKESLEKLDLGGYLSGWGWKLDDAAKKALGERFTIAQAIAYAEPILRAKHDAAEARRLAGDQKRADAFAEARRTGQPVVLKRWSEECDGSTEECDVDSVTLYALPDGSTEKTRSHSY